MENKENILIHIRQRLAYLNPALVRIGQYILENPELCKTMTIKELATECAVAESSVTRFVKEIEFDSYQELKIAIAESLTLTSDSLLDQSYVYEDITKNDTAAEIIDKIYHRNVQMLNLTRQMINPAEITQATNAIEKAKTIIFACKGSSAIAAEEGVMRFSRAGKKCLFFRDESIQLIVASTVTPGDLVIGISNSGRSISVVNVLKLAHEQSVSTIGITAFEDSPLAKNSDITLFTPTKQSDTGDGMGWESTSSKSAQILIIDTLYACYAARCFDQTRDFLDKTYKAIRHTRF